MSHLGKWTDQQQLQKRLDFTWALEDRIPVGRSWIAFAGRGDIVRPSKLGKGKIHLGVHGKSRLFSLEQRVWFGVQSLNSRGSRLVPVSVRLPSGDKNHINYFNRENLI